MRAIVRDGASVQIANVISEIRLITFYRCDIVERGLGMLRTTIMHRERSPRMIAMTTAMTTVAKNFDSFCVADGRYARDQ